MSLLPSLKNLTKMLLNQLSAFSINFSIFSIDKVDLTIASEKKVVSFCLFGYDRKYFANINACVRSYNFFFPTWIVRVYTSNDLPKDIISNLQNLKCEIIIMKSTGIDFRYTFWRFLVLDDRNVSYAIVRDIDSLASNREKMMVDQWISSKLPLHVIRDHPDHIDLIMGGMFGCRFDAELRIKKRMLKFKKLNQLGIDQNFLKLIYAKYSPNILIHDIFLRYKKENPVIIRHENINNFIGEINIDHRYKQRDLDKLKDFYSEKN